MKTTRVVISGRYESPAADTDIQEVEGRVVRTEKTRIRMNSAKESDRLRLINRKLRGSISKNLVSSSH